MPATITNYSVPSTKYRYKFPGPGVADSEHLQLTVDPTLVGPKVGRAVLVLDVKTPGFPGSIPPTPGISNVTISLCVPMTTLSNEVPAAVPPGANIDPRTSSVTWREASIAPGVAKTYQVDFDWSASTRRKVEVVIRADEIERPIRVVVRI